MRRKKISIIGALVLGLVMSGCGSVATRLEQNKLNANISGAEIDFGSASGSTNINSGSITGDDNKGFTWTITTEGTSSFTPNSAYAQIGSKNSPASEITFTTTLDKNYTITNLSAKFGGFSGTTGTVSLKVGTDTIGSGSLSGTTDVTINNSTNTVVGRVLTVSVTGIQKGVKAYWIKYACTDNSGGQQGPTALTNPNPQYDAQNHVVTWTTDANASEYQIKVDSGNYAEITTESYDTSSLEPGNHTVFIKAVSNNENYTDSEGSVNFNIPEPPAPFVSTDFVPCTSTSDLEAGAKYIITGNNTVENVTSVYAMKTEDNANNRRGTLVSIENNKIASTSDTLILTLGGESNAWTFATNNYAGTAGYLNSGSGTSAKLYVSATNDNYGLYTISFSEDKAVISAVNKTSYNTIRFNYNNGSPLFSSYTSGQADIYLWKEYSTKTLDSLEVTGTPTHLSGYYTTDTFNPEGITKYEAVYSDGSRKTLAASDIVWPPLTAGMTSIRGSYTEGGITKYTPTYTISAVLANNIESITLTGAIKTNYFMDQSWDKHTLTVTANYTNGNHVDVTNDSTITYYGNEEMTEVLSSPSDLQVCTDRTIYIKATYENVSNTVGYAQVVTVSIEHGTLITDPLSADDAIGIGKELAVNGKTTTEYYISGTVENVEENNLGAGYNNATFTLVSSTQGFAFKGFRVSPDANLNADDYSKLVAGAEVLIKGKIQRYSETLIENVQSGSYILSISLTETLTGISLDKTELSLNPGDTATITPSPIPSTVALGEVTWSTSNNGVASVENGVVSAVAAGTAVITARVDENISATCTVTVTNPVKSTSGKLFVDMTGGSIVGPEGYSVDTQNIASGSGYFKEKTGGQVTYFSLKGNSPLFSFEPSSIVFKARIGSSQAKDTLGENPIVVCFIDEENNEIDGTSVVLTSSLNTSATNYEVEIPYSSSAYGVKMKHTKESGWNPWYYNFELSFQSARTFAKLSATETEDGGSVSLSNVKLRFGATLTPELRNTIETSVGEITRYGVLMFRAISALNTYSKTPVQDLFKAGETLKDFGRDVTDSTFNPENNFTFSAGADIQDSSQYNIVLCAAPYVVAGGQYYFLGEMQYSVKMLADEYIENGGTNLSAAALAILAGTNN